MSHFKRIGLAFAIIFIFSVSAANAQPLFNPWLHLKNVETYKMEYTLIVLDHETFKIAAKHYSIDPDKTDAFTITYGEKTGMPDIYVYIDKGTENGEPYSDDIGHETKHIIDNKYFQATGLRRFEQDCTKWKEARPQ